MSGSCSNATSSRKETTSRRLASLQRDLHDCGFDIFVPFHPPWYNDFLDRDDEHFQHLLRLPAAAEEEDAEAFLIGNTKHLWPFFKVWLREQQQQHDSQEQQQQQQVQVENTSSLMAFRENDEPSPSSPSSSSSCPRRRLTYQQQHPLDSYCQECIEKCVQTYFVHPQSKDHAGSKDEKQSSRDDEDDKSSSSYRIYWSSTFAPDQMVSMQHVSMVSGFAYFDPLTNLCVHPVYGTWHAYRAVVVVVTTTTTRCIYESAAASTNSMDRPMIRPVPLPPPPPPRVPCLLSAAEQECAIVALARAIDLCTRNSCNTASADMTSICSINNSSASRKKSCFDILLHGQNKNVHRQVDEGCNLDNGKNTTSSSRMEQRHDGGDDDDNFLSICQAWIDLRDCVQTGKEQYRYDYDQLMYHFTKDQRYLLDSSLERSSK
jgi:hypothetical protein